MPKPQVASAEPDLRQYLAVLMRRKWIVLVAVVLAVGSSLVFSFARPKVYEAQSAVLIRGGASEVVFRQQAPTTPVAQDVEVESRILKGESMKEAITKDLGYFPEVKVELGDDTPRIALLARNSSATTAAKHASDFATSFVKERRRTIGNELTKAIQSVTAEQSSLDTEATAAARRIREIDALVPNTPNEDARTELEFERTRLQESISTGSIAQRQSSILQTLSDLQRAKTTNEVRGTYTVSRAVVPTSPIFPKPLLNAAIALLTGLLLGVGAAFARDYFDDSMRTKEDLDASTGGVPVLSLIPAVPGWRDRDDTLVESMAHPHSATSEAYRSFRTALEFAAIEHKIGLIHITSSTSGEGKTTTAANLAVALANTGKRVVLVDCDLRRPRVHKFFDMDNSIGFTSVLVGEIEAQDALQEAAGVPRLLVLPSGPRPPNPSELLSTKAAHTLLETLGKFADNVVIDSPPLLPVADSSVLAGYADATVLVVAAKSTTRRSLKRSLELLSQVNAPLEGILFNGVGHDATYGYGYGYTYAYSDDEPNGRGSRKKQKKQKVDADRQDD